MRQLRLVSIIALAVLALGTTGAGTALATEGDPGWLPLEALKTPIEVTTESASAQFKWAGGEIECGAFNTLHFELGAKSDTHVTLTIDTDVHVKECKSGMVGCRSENAKGEKDPVETTLVLIDFHLADLLNSGTHNLEPGIVAIVLNSNLELLPIKIACGVIAVEIRGAAKGLVLVSSLAAEITSGSFDFSSTFDKCDSTDKLCIELENQHPLQVKTNSEFEGATEQVTLPFKLSQMVLVDD